MAIENTCKYTETEVPATGEAKASDPSIYRQLVRPWELCNTPTESGDFGYHMQYVIMPGITLYREKYNLGCQIQGLSPANIFVLSVPLQTDMRSSYCGVPVCTSSLPIALPGGMETRFHTGHDHIILLMELRLLAEYLPPEYYSALQRSANNHQLPSSVTKVKPFGRWLLELLNSVHLKPDILKYSVTAHSIREDLLNRLMDVIHIPDSSPHKTNLSKRSLGMKRALEFLREEDISSVSIPKISRAAEVSLRTLEYAFRDTFGLTPLAYLRLQRMHAARHTLRVSSPETTTVIAVASEFGFYQPGKFAVDYRKFFNEPPSQTLKQPCMENVFSPLTC